MKLTRTLFLVSMLAMLGFQACKKNEIVEPEIAKPVKKSWTDTVEVYKFAVQVSGQRDLNWQWNDPQLNYIPVSHYNILRDVVNREITLPWRTQGNSLNGNNPDIKTEDGWELVLSNFGTPDKAVDLPFLAIYNKKKSLLKCFVYNVNRISANDFVGKLAYYGADQTHASLVSKIKAHTTQANTYDSWINLEFELPYNELEELIKNKSLGINVRCLAFWHYNLNY